MNRLIVIAVSALFLISASGCKSAKQQTAAPAPQAQPAGAANPMPPAISLAGKVVETMNSGGYTYAFIEKNGQKAWVAAPQTKIKVGQQVICDPGMAMQNFTSKTLHRTFDIIVFTTGIH
jgi:hypothetical protein